MRVFRLAIFELIDEHCVCGAASLNNTVIYKGEFYEEIISNGAGINDGHRANLS